MKTNEIVNEILSKKFQDYIYDRLNDNRWDILDRNPEEYGGKYDSNPYGVEPQLASGSGCWVFSESAEDEVFERAKEEMLTAIDEAYFSDFQKYKPLEELFSGYYTNTDEEWVKALLVYAVQKVEQ